MNQHLATLRDRIVRYEEHRAALAEVADDVSALALFFDAKEFYFTENLSADMEEIIKLSRKLRSGYQTYMSQGGDWEEFIEIRDDLLVRISNVRQKLIAQARCHLGVDKLTL